MKKKNRFSVPSKYIFAALALLCVGMMFASYSTGFAGSTLGRISGYVFVPFERGINTVGGWLRSRADSLEDLADAQAKNEELQSQVDELTLENSRLMQNWWIFRHTLRTVSTGSLFSRMKVNRRSRISWEALAFWFSIALLSSRRSSNTRCNACGGISGS